MEHTDISDKVVGSSDQENGYESGSTMPDYRTQKKAINKVVKGFIRGFKTGEALEKKNKNTPYQSNRQKLYEGLECALENEGFGDVVESVREQLEELGQKVPQNRGGVMLAMEELEPKNFIRLMNGKLGLPEAYVNHIAEYNRRRQIIKQVMFGDSDSSTIYHSSRNSNNGLIVIS